MALVPDDVVPLAPTADHIKPRLLAELFKAQCKYLRRGAGGVGDVWKRTPMLGSRRDLYLAWFAAQGWIANPTFAEGGRLLRLDLARIKCPWYAQESIRVHVKVEFFEQTNPANEHIAPPVIYDLDWHRNTVLEETVQSGAIPDPYPEDNGPWSADILLSVNEDADECVQAVNAEGTLAAGGYDFIAGQPLHQVREPAMFCQDFVDGLKSAFFAWVGVGPFNLGHGYPPEVALIRTLWVTIYCNPGEN